MKKLILPIGIAATALCLLQAAKLDSPATNYTTHHENVLGTSMEMQVDADSPETSAKAEAAALAEIDRLAKLLSSYDKSSEFSRWFATNGKAVAVSPELLEVLGLFDQWRTATGGALNPAAEAVNRVWKNAAKENRLPSSGELSAASAAAGQAHWKLDLANGTATHLTNTPIALNSFTKSYVIAKATSAALKTGAYGAMINIGGDVVTSGDRTQVVSIADPLANADNAEPASRIKVSGRAVATSGNYKRGVEINGQHYSHIVDPRTGQTAEQIISSTVVALNATDAGALATAFSILTPAESRRLAATIPGAEYLLIDREGNRTTSAGWSQLEFQPAQIASAKLIPGMLAAQGQGGAAWNSAFELSITLAVSQIEGGRARRPYVAVWIEDKDKFPVRTIALWFNKDRWLPELRSWMHDDRVRSLAEGTDITGTVASATRPAGKYTLKWDGKDNAGKLVKPGKYTVIIEASREHGTYQVMKQEMDFSGTPKQVSLTGNTEIESATLDYRKSSSR